MTSLDAGALQTDPDGLARLRGVLGTAPAEPRGPAMWPVRTAPAEPPGPAMSPIRTACRLGLVGSAALLAVATAASPAKPTVPRADADRPAATESRREAPRAVPPPRPVRTVTKFAAVAADPAA